MAAAILAVDPDGVGGVALRSAPGPVRDHWMEHFAAFGSPCYKIPLHVTDTRLLGGLDLAATLQAGRPVSELGILATAHRGTVVLAMAERLSASMAAKLTAVLDSHAVVLEREGFAKRISTRFAVIALDEGIDSDERPPAGLLDRLALHVDLNGLRPGEKAGYSRPEVSAARDNLASVQAPESILVALCEAAAAFGVDSARAPLFALRVARAVAALAGRTLVTEEDAGVAARLVFAPRAIKAPGEQAAAGAVPDPAESDTPADAASATSAPDQTSAAGSAPSPPDEPSRHPAPDSLSERVIEATRGALPLDFQAHLQRIAAALTHSRSSGRSSGEHACLRGRPAGIRCGDPRGGARLSVIDTLRAAAPWQKLRRKINSTGVRVVKDDFRVIVRKRRNQLTTIFLVDASGSAALHRLAEVKGAVELMLANSYVRRDRVALISFRGTSAQMLLPPTTSLVRAKRELASLPGGGGTPMARGLDAARVLADSLHRRGESPVVVVLTDGRPNVTRDGIGNRAKAEADTINAARLIRSSAIASLMVDTAPQPRVLTEQVAHEMGARYVPLPYADAGSLASVVRQVSVDWRPHA